MGKFSCPTSKQMMICWHHLLFISYTNTVLTENTQSSGVGNLQIGWTQHKNSPEKYDIRLKKKSTQTSHKRAKRRDNNYKQGKRTKARQKWPTERVRNAETPGRNLPKFSSENQLLPTLQDLSTYRDRKIEVDMAILDLLKFLILSHTTTCWGRWRYTAYGVRF